MSDEDLVRRLRRASFEPDFDRSDAADAIERLTRERDDLRKALSAALKETEKEDGDLIARHIKRGTTYDVLGEAHIQSDKPLSDMDRVVVYRCHQTGALWVRRYAEFCDGNRFEIIDRAALKETGNDAESAG